MRHSCNRSSCSTSPCCRRGRQRRRSNWRAEPTWHPLRTHSVQGLNPGGTGTFGNRKVRGWRPGPSRLPTSVLIPGRERRSWSRPRQPTTYYLRQARMNRRPIRPPKPVRLSSPLRPSPSLSQDRSTANKSPRQLGTRARPSPFSPLTLLGRPIHYPLKLRLRSLPLRQGQTLLKS